MTADHKKIKQYPGGNGASKPNGTGKHEVNGQIQGNGNKGMELLAKSMFRELQKSGYDLGQIIDFSGKLIGFVHNEITTENDEGGANKGG